MALTERFVTPRELPADLHLPPGPRWPKPVQTVLFMGARDRLAPRWQRRYGDVYSVHIAPAGRAIVLTRPEHIREVFAGPADTFHAGEGNAILGPIMGEHSVLLLDEATHLASRKRVMSAFHGEATANWGAVVERLTEDTVARWPRDTVFAAHPYFNDISLEVILRIVFGVSDEQRLAELRPMLKRLVKIGPTIFLGWFYPGLERFGPWRQYNELKERVDAAVYREIRERRDATDLATRNDVLSRLLVAEPGQSDAELRDHLITLLLAGHETTASTLAWIVHDLARLPQVQARARQAADDRDDAYLDAVVKESMRLRPVIGNVARRLNKPARIAGYDLPAGVVVFPSILLVQRDRAAFPDPGEFRPERFLGKNPPQGTWIPFGGGIRRCLGAALATVEARAALGVVLRTVELRAAARPEYLKARNVTTIPGRGARVSVHSR